jgi:hypothetical protein
MVHFNDFLGFVDLVPGTERTDGTEHTTTTTNTVSQMCTDRIGLVLFKRNNSTKVSE